MLPVLVFSLLACAGCGLLGGAKKAKKDNDTQFLTPIRAKTLYVLPSELPQEQLRVALVDTTLVSGRASATLTIGSLRPRDGFFKIEIPVTTGDSIKSLVAAFDPYIDRMPVGIIVTVNGQLPGTEGVEPPAAFNDFVLEFQDALLKEKIQFAFVVPSELHTVK